MNKSLINKYCRKLGFEIHGAGYMQSLTKGAFKDDAFLKQQELLNNKASVIFDIGANHGTITLQYHKLFPAADIFSFEPFPYTFSSLKEKTSHINKVHLSQNAVGEVKGNMDFYVNHNADTNSLLKPTKMGLNSDKQVENKEKIQVKVITIDQFCEQHKIDHIDILKLDIQGGELAALRGAERLLMDKKIRLIYAEAYFREQYVDQPLFHDISRYLRQFDYYLQDLYTPIYGKGSIAWGDVIFLPL